MVTEFVDRGDMRYFLLIFFLNVSLASSGQDADTISLGKIPHIPDSLRSVVFDSVSRLSEKFYQRTDSLFRQDILSRQRAFIDSKLDTLDPVLSLKKRILNLNKIRSLGSDTLRLRSIIRDSIKNTIKLKSGSVDGLDSLLRLKDQLGIDSLGYRLDSADIKKASEYFEKQGEDYLGNLKEIEAFENEIEKFNELVNPAQSLQEKFTDHGFPMDLKDVKTPSLKSIPQDKILQQKEKIKGAQAFLNKYKKKYDELPSINDLNSAVRKNSLQEKKFVERIGVGGNFQIIIYKPFTIDLSPTVAFNVNKLFQIGAALEFRYVFQYNDALSADKLTEGYLVFANHHLIKNFFGYTEFGLERAENASNEEIKKDYIEIWQIGLGRKITLSPILSINALILFNPLFDPAELQNTRRWNFKIGFQYNLKRLINKKEE